MPEQTPRRRTSKATAADQPADDTKDDAAAEKPAAEKPAAAKKTKTVDDPRVGRSVPAHWDTVGYDDGAQYRCEGGVIVERTN